MIVNEGRPGGVKLPALTNPGAAANLLSGKQLINQNGEIVTGTMTNRGNVSQSLNAGGSYTIPAGYHSGGGKVTAKSLASQTSATATAADIKSGKTAWVNGSRITGTGQMSQKTSFGFLCHGTNDDIRVYTDVSFIEMPNGREYYDIPSGSTRAWTFYCTVGSIVAIRFGSDADSVSGSAATNFEFLCSAGGLDTGDTHVRVFMCIDENGTMDVRS